MKSARICLMKKVVGGLVVASVITLGVYFYMNTGATQVRKDSPASATVSAPVEIKDQQKETKKPAPELKSFEGLDEESSGIFNGDVQTQSPSEDPLKAATQ